MSLTLKLAVAVATLLPFSPRIRVSDTVDRSRAVDLEPLPIVLETVSTAEPEAPAPVVELCDRNTAFRQFMDYMMEEWGNEEFAFAAIFKIYNLKAPAMGWPPIKDKPFAILLRANGCIRFQKDLRKRRLGKPIYFRFPDNWDEAASNIEAEEAA